MSESLIGKQIQVSLTKRGSGIDDNSNVLKKTDYFLDKPQNPMYTLRVAKNRNTKGEANDLPVEELKSDFFIGKNLCPDYRKSGRNHSLSDGWQA